LTSTARGDVVFDVWTPDNLQRAAQGNTGNNARPIGSGTLHPTKDGASTYDRYGENLVWTGESERSQTYMVQVKSKARAPAQYNLSVSGNYAQVPFGTLADQAANQGAKVAGSSQPAAQPTAQATATAAKSGAKASASQAAAANKAVAANKASVTATPAATKPTVQPTSTAPNRSPDTALALDWAVHQINPGESQWWVLDYPGRLNNGVIPNGTIVITALPYGSANFEIWSKDRLRALELGDTRIGVPVGTGMLHPITRDGVTTDQWDSKPAWTNRSAIPAQFLIKVTTTGSAPSSYNLEYIQK
jgi:hypothetical protein